MKVLGLTGIFLFFFLTVFPQQNEKQGREALKIAWQQKILLNKIINSYMKIGSGVGDDKELKELDANIAQFDANFEKLEELAVTEKHKKNLANIYDQWIKFRNLAISPVSIYDASYLLLRGKWLEKYGSKALKEYSKDYHFDDKQSEVYFFASITELAYELSMYYYAHYWGVDKVDDDYSEINLNLPKKYWLAKRKLEDILNQKNRLKNASSYYVNAKSILKSRYNIPDKRLTQLDKSDGTLQIFQQFEDEFARFAEKHLNKLFENE